MRALESLADVTAAANHWSMVADVAASKTPLVALDLREQPHIAPDKLGRLVEVVKGAPWVTVTAVDGALPAWLHGLADAADIVLAESEAGPTAVCVDSVDTEVARLAERVTASPAASVALAQLLRLSEHGSIELALHGESLTYGLLQTGPTFGRWLAERTNPARRSGPASDTPTAAPAALAPERVVRAERSGGVLAITLDRSDKRNAINVAMRDQLTEALELLDADSTLDGAVLDGAGDNFCSGGDLDEFGTTPSPLVGHHVRTVRSLPRLFHQVRDRLRVHVHGSCIGAGIELPAFSHAVIADPETSFRLPEVGFGLVPGAGGTVSVSRRCGRHRTAWWAITGDTIDAPTALRWNLIDRIASR